MTLANGRMSFLKPMQEKCMEPETNDFGYDMENDHSELLIQ